MINGLFCHETGCPNMHKVWDSEEQEWIKPEPEEEEFAYFLDDQPPVNKRFFWKDKSGRGNSGNFKLDGILATEDEENYDGDSLHEWAQEAEEGDEFESATDHYTCTSV
jgi:hypothetical protein